jgi:phosphatidylethanolamine/phosphatidyl-N-methylethanolamine N-methyltransferase
MSTIQTITSSTQDQNNWINHQLGDLNEINRYFSINKGNLLNRYLSVVIEKIQRIIHLFRTGFWINSHSLGQALNAYRFEVTKGEFERIETLVKIKLGSDFTEKAYQSATEETMMESFQNSVEFFVGFIRSPTTVGSLLPSSQKLAKGIAKDIPETESEDTPKRYYLEVGPGTGTFTKQLIKKLRENDQLDLVEYDEKFVKILQRRFGHLNNVNIIKGDFTKFDPQNKYDYCISGLPLAAFPKDMVVKVYEVFNKVVKKEGALVYFEYMGLPRLKETFLKGKKYENFKEILKIKKKYYDDHQGKRKNIWLNMTPAYICNVTL